MVFEWRGQEYTGSITFILFSIRRFYNEYYRIHYWKYFHSSFLTNNKRRQLKSLSNVKYILPGEQIIPKIIQCLPLQYFSRIKINSSEDKVFQNSKILGNTDRMLWYGGVLSSERTLNKTYRIRQIFLYLLMNTKSRFCWAKERFITV